MGASITLAGESLIAQKLGSQQRLDVARFIFANVPGLDPNAPVNRAAPKPPAAQIVHSYTIPQQNVGFVNPNQVVYSSMLGSDVGDFDWNWIGLETAENVLLAVAYMPLQQKRKNIPPLQLGNNVTRNILVVFDGAQALTGITIDAKTWQHDFTVRLKGIDERERLSNRDVFGRACFFESAFQVEKVGATYQLKPGLAYVEGIRVELAGPVAIVPTKMPTQAWLHVSLRRELNDVVATWKVDFEPNQVDFLDANGQRVYCIALGDLTASAISDRRVVEPISGALIQHLAARNGDYQYLRARATTKADVGLGNLPNAISDDADADSTFVLASTKALASVRRFLQQAIDKLVSGATPAGKAKQLETARKLSISGAGTGSANFDGSSDVDIKLTMPDIVAAWKYTKVTVSSKGLVIQGENLQAVDIPALDWSKINSGTPTTLAGYGITDAQPLAQLLSDYVKNKGWGLGQPEPVSVVDANTALLPGFYSASGTGAKNFGDGFSPLLVLKRMSGPIGQIQLNPRDNLLYHRGSNNGGESWTNWEAAWNTGNLKKTTSPIDTTSGSMLRVGDFGIGAMVIHPEGDLNKLLTAGKFLSTSSPSGVPAGWPAGRSLIDITGGASYAMQLLASTAARRVAIRTTSGDEIYPWMELWHSENHAAASKVEAEEGTSLDRWMSPGRVFQAIAKKVVQATEAVVGVAAIATQAFVNAGADDTTIVTPKKMRFGFSISLAENGYIVFPTWMGSLIVQWGNLAPVPSNHLVDVTYPIAFPTAVRFSIGGFLGDSGTTGTDAISVTTRSRVGMTLRCAGDNSALPVNWIAFGH